MEIWKEPPSLLGVEVSSLGRVRVKKHVGKMPRGGTRLYGGVESFGVIGDGGRRQFSYKGKTYRIHKLVAEAFMGPKPFKDAIVMHLDENVGNNKADNLAYGTQRQNLNAPGFIRYCQSRTGKNSPVIKGRSRF